MTWIVGGWLLIGFAIAIREWRREWWFRSKWSQLAGTIPSWDFGDFVVFGLFWLLWPVPLIARLAKKRN